MRHRTLIAGVCALLALACGSQKLPTAPDELTEGIVIYKDRDFKGKSAYVATDIPDLRSYSGPCEVSSDNGDGTTSSTNSWDNCISSIRVAPGWRATIYGDTKYRGGTLEITGDVADLRRVPGTCGEGLNDCVSSIRVSR